jgi:predicted TIM-barrel fold metal-dependent hydrolase
VRVVDCHVHVTGPVEVSVLLRDMDANAVDRVLLISPYERASPERARANLDLVRRIARQAPDRLGVLAWVNPAMRGSRHLAKEALTDKGFCGLKIIPDHWYPHERRLDRFWKTLDDLHASVLFHTGILYAFEDGSRFCRPVYLERLQWFRNIRFAMAHLSWPWCDECLAVMGRMRSAAEEGGFAWQSYVDTTPGTPPYIRAHALASAVDFCGPERLMFGSDSEVPGNLEHQRSVKEADLEAYRSLGLPDAQIARILAGTADELFPAR